MNDQDYIRKAVELADEWNLSDNTQIYLPNLPFPTWTSIERVPQIMLDALAAQLVRQVDATDYELRISPRSVLIYDDPMDSAKWIAEGPHRAMNIIKIVVDSKVLE